MCTFLTANYNNYSRSSPYELTRGSRHHDGYGIFLQSSPDLLSQMIHVHLAFGVRVDQIQIVRADALERAQFFDRIMRVD